MDEKTGNSKADKAKFLRLIKPLASPAKPRQAEYNGFVQANPDKNPITQPYTGPSADENNSVHTPENINPISIPKIEILLKEGIKHIQEAYIAVI